VLVHTEYRFKKGGQADLVFGPVELPEVIVELKLSKAGSGGYTKAVEKWQADIAKLNKYKTMYPNARCILLGIDQGDYLSSPSSQNYFDPSEVGLRVNWITENFGRLLFAEIEPRDPCTNR